MQGRSLNYVVEGVENRHGFPLTVNLMSAISGTLATQHTGPMVCESDCLNGPQAQILFIRRSDTAISGNPTDIGASLQAIYACTGTLV